LNPVELIFRMLLAEKSTRTWIAPEKRRAFIPFEVSTGSAVVADD
jgi:hypothetical protein